MSEANAAGSDRVLIVGAGIAGLTLAGALSREKIRCEIVERAPAFAPVGAGIVLGVNAMRALHRLGCTDSLIERGHVLGEMAITDARERVLARTNLAALEPRFGPSVALHRAALHEVLLKHAAGVPIRLGLTVEAIASAESPVRVRFSDGSEGRYSEVAGADGLRSQTRTLIFGDVPLDYSGYTCWRLVAQRPANMTRAQEMWGRGKRFGIVPIDEERVYCFAVANAPEREVDPPEGRLARFRARFSGFAGPVPDILAQLDAADAGEDGLIHNDLSEVVQRPWYRAGVVLVGDAAHGMTPNMGQGAAMALEDVIVLAELAGAASRAGLPMRSVFRAWAERRESRVAWVQTQSRRFGRVAQWEGRIACTLRNNLLRLVPDRANEATLVRLAEQPI